MKEKALFNKYNKGKHWEHHPTAYAERFCSFLRESGFKGRIMKVAAMGEMSLALSVRAFRQLG